MFAQYRREVQEFCDPADFPAYFGVAHFAGPERKGNIFINCQSLIQCVRLKRQCNVSFRRTQSVDDFFVKQDFTSTDFLQPG